MKYLSPLLPYCVSLVVTALTLYFIMLLMYYPPFISNYTSILDSAKILHGVYPGGFSGEEDDFSEVDLISYERSVDSTVDFVYFSHNWYKSRQFPKNTVDWIYKRGSIPYIRLMLRSHPLNQGFNEREYSVTRIGNKELDSDLYEWFKIAKSYKKPLIVEYGTEINGDFFPWNGAYYDKSSLPFKKAYRHIIDISREVGAINIIWSFHLNDRDVPNEEWNHFENYYPGDNYIDLIVMSIYGMLTSIDTQQKYVGTELKTLYPRIAKMAPTKKIILIEWASTRDNKYQDQVEYARDGFEAIFSGNYPNLIGFSWWNEWWHNRGQIDSTMRVQDNPKLALVFKEYLH